MSPSRPWPAVLVVLCQLWRKGSPRSIHRAQPSRPRRSVDLGKSAGSHCGPERRLGQLLWGETSGLSVTRSLARTRVVSHAVHSSPSLLARSAWWHFASGRPTTRCSGHATAALRLLLRAAERERSAPVEAVSEGKCHFELRALLIHGSSLRSADSGCTRQWAPSKHHAAS